MQLGGIPRIRNITIDVTGRYVQFDALSMHVVVKVTGGTLRVYFKQADFDDDQNYFELATGDDFNLPIEDRGLWVRGVGGASDVQLLVIHRKG